MKKFCAITIICILFLCKVINVAENKAFWVDETFGYDVISHQGFGEMLIKGMDSQFSKPPLDYIFLKIWRNLRFGTLPDLIYYRLNSILWILLSGIFMALMFRRNWILICGALIVYYFNSNILHYAAETRPYALWLSLLLVAFTYYMKTGKLDVKLSLIFCLSALTSSGSSIVIYCFGAACWVTGTERPLKILKYLAAPMSISVYYMLKQDGLWSYEPQELFYKSFFTFWMKSYLVPVLSVIGFYMVYRFRGFQAHTVIFITMLLLYLLSPLINCVVIEKYGMFFHPRYYIYYKLMLPLFLISLSHTYMGKGGDT